MEPILTFFCKCHEHIDVESHLQRFIKCPECGRKYASPFFYNEETVDNWLLRDIAANGPVYSIDAAADKRFADFIRFAWSPTGDEYETGYLMNKSLRRLRTEGYQRIEDTRTYVITRRWTSEKFEDAVIMEWKTT